MLTGHKKSRYNIYDKLEFLGLTPYELKHFCFGEGEGSDGPGDSGEPGSPNTGPQFGGLPGEPDDIDEDFAGSNRGRGTQQDMPSVDYFDTQKGIDPVDLGFFGNVEDKEKAVGKLKQIREVNPLRAQNILDMRVIDPAVLDIKSMNALEKAGMKTFGLGYRGPFEARSVKGLERESYDPNTLTGAGTDERSYNMAMFQSFAKANPSLTTVEAVAQHNAESPTLSVSINDAQQMGFDLNAPVGPQADFREAVAQRGLAQGIGLLAAGPISGMATIATDGKGIVGMLSEVLGIEEEVETLGFGKIPSYQEVALDFFGPGPERDTMNPAGFNISADPVAGPSTPTDEDVGFTGFASEGISLDGNEEITPLSPQVEPIIKEQEEIVATPFPAFPTIDTVPKSRVDRIASIYNISKEAAERMLGVTA